MTPKSLIVVAALALSSLGIASAKSYAIKFDTAVMAGNVQMQPGEYRLKVEGGNAIFTNIDSQKQFTAPVKTETAPQKFDATATETKKLGNNERLEYIELGGSNTKLEFGE